MMRIITRAMIVVVSFLILVASTLSMEMLLKKPTMTDVADFYARNYIYKHPIKWLGKREHYWLIMSIMKHESSMDNTAIRYDKRQLMKQKWFVKLRNQYDLTNKKFFYSVGLGQVLFIDSWINGLRSEEGDIESTFELLKSPNINVRETARILSAKGKRLIKARNSRWWIEALACSYNSGFADYKDGVWNRQNYVDEVMSMYDCYKQEYKNKEKKNAD
jgi:hypothetical protein